MNVTYDLVAKRHERDSRPNVILYSNKDREKVIWHMKKYDTEHGFTLDDWASGKITIATLLLRERKLTGEVLSETP